MKGFQLDSTTELLGLIQHAYPQIWKDHQAAEKWERNEILDHLTELPSKIAKVSLLHKALYATRNSIKESPWMYHLDKIFFNGSMNITDYLSGLAGIMRREFNMNLIDPEVSKVYPLIERFVQIAESEFSKDKMDFQLLVDCYVEIESSVPEDVKYYIINDPMITTAKRLFDKNNEKEAEITFLSNYLTLYLLKERIDWIRKKISDINDEIQDEVKGCRFLGEDFIKIEGGMREKAIERSFDFLCEATFQGKTLFSKEDVDVLKRIGLSLPKEGSSYTGPKLRYNNISKAKTIMYGFMYELWYSHAYELKGTKHLFCLFLYTYIEGLPSVESIESQMRKADKNTLKKIRMYVPPRSEIHG